MKQKGRAGLILVGAMLGGAAATLVHGGCGSASAADVESLTVECKDKTTQAVYELPENTPETFGRLTIVETRSDGTMHQRAPDPPKSGKVTMSCDLGVGIELKSITFVLH